MTAPRVPLKWMPFPSGGRPTGTGPPPFGGSEILSPVRVARMKTSQWIAALAALVLVVFLSTFAINYIGSSQSNDTTTEGDPEPASLTFPVKSYPYISVANTIVGRLEMEYHKHGHQDYWFINENDEPVKLGAISKSCKCQGVEVYVLPPGFQAKPPISLPVPVVALAVGPLGWRAVATLSERRDSTEELEAKAISVTALNPEDPRTEVTVPPKCAGWVRMKWTGEKSGAQLLTVKLWMHHPTSGLEVSLERKSNFLEPVMLIENEKRLGSIRPSDLPVHLSFYVLSPTRDSFNITKAQAVRPASLPAASDAFEVGKPVALTADECRGVFREFNKWVTKSGYRIPVTLRKVAPDGKTPFDMGRFRRSIEIVTDVSDKPLTMTYSGTIPGDLQISGVDEAGGISFGPFRRGSPVMRTVSIRTNNPAVKLELDKKRIPEYVEATLKEDPSEGTTGVWNLELKIAPSAYGSFPRDDDPVYQDSAVYLRTTGPSPQSFRLELRGDAVDN